jgi:glucokinase
MVSMESSRQTVASSAIFEGIFLHLTAVTPLMRALSHREMPGRGTIGIDIGGTKTLLALFDEKFAVIHEIKVSTHPEKGEKYFTEVLSESVEKVVEKAEKEKLILTGVGIGCAGSVDRARGVLRSSPNIPFLKDYPFGSRLTRLAGTNVVLGNDVQLGLYGEHQLGAAKGCQHVIGVFFGTGVGGAMIIDGKLHLGANGAAGDIGQYLLNPIGPLAGSERQGVLDDFVGRHAIAGEAAGLAAKQWAPHLFEIAGADVTEIKSGTLAEAIKKGDTKVEEMVRSRARMAGIALSNLVDFINPELVVIGGGMVDAMPHLFLKEVEAGIREFTVPEIGKSVKVSVTKLKDHAVTTGAAKLAWDKFVSEEKVGTAA